MVVHKIIFSTDLHAFILVRGRWNDKQFDGSNYYCFSNHIHIIMIYKYFNNILCIKKIIITKIACGIATNWSNWMILASLKRRELDLSNDGRNIKFAAIDGKLQSNWKNIWNLDMIEQLMNKASLQRRIIDTCWWIRKK